MTHEEAIGKLKAIHTWAAFALDKGSADWAFSVEAMENVRDWTQEIIRMLEAEEDDGK